MEVILTILIVGLFILCILINETWEGFLNDSIKENEEIYKDINESWYKTCKDINESWYSLLAEQNKETAVNFYKENKKFLDKMEKYNK